MWKVGHLKMDCRKKKADLKKRIKQKVVSSLDLRTIIVAVTNADRRHILRGIVQPKNREDQPQK